MENVLKKIIDKKKEKIEIYKRDKSESKLLEDIKNIKNFVDFKKNDVIEAYKIIKSERTI